MMISVFIAKKDRGKYGDGKETQLASCLHFKKSGLSYAGFG